MGIFRFKEFHVHNDASAMKVGTDSVLLGAAMTLSGNERRLLDIGTGTGVVALLAAQRLSEMGADFLVDAVEIDGAAAGEAALNFMESPWKERLRVHHCPVQKFPASDSYDCIFSNPPYYDSSLENPDPEKARARHTGSLSYTDLCRVADSLLTPGGRFCVILPQESRASLFRTAASFGLFPSRIVEIFTSPAKPCRRIIAEFLRCRTDCSTEAIDLQQPNCTAKFYLW